MARCREDGIIIAQIAKGFAVDEMTLRNWIRQVDIDDSNRWCQCVEATWGSPASSRAKDSVGVRKPSRRRGRLLISSAMVVR